MSITVVCITLTDTGHSSRTILIKDTSAENLIMVADRFMALYNEHARVNTGSFVELKCFVDEREVPMITLIEQASTAYAAVRRKVFGDKGFVTVKHEVSVQHFIGQMISGKSILGQAPPKWVGPVASTKQGKAKLESSLIDQDRTEVTASTPLASVSLAQSPGASSAPALDSPEMRPRRMPPGNFGKLGR